MSTVLTRDEFGGLFKSFSNSAFRLETLDLYTVPQEASEYQRFLAGEELPNTADSEWVKFVRASVSEGKTIQRVHAISLPLTSYIKYEIHWGYAYTSAAGEDIRLLDRNKLSPALASVKDFWLFDEKTLVIVHYDSDGRFLHGEMDDSQETLGAYIDIRAILMSQSTPLRQFLARERAA